jgi:hypothetical protein
MPYAVRKRGSQYVVVNADTGRVFGRHSTKSKAERQKRALYANAKD